MQSYHTPAGPFAEQLDSMETVLWEGKPNRRAFVLRGSWFMVPFSIVWAGFAIFWEVMLILGGAPFFLSLWGIPFVLIGLYMLFGRFFVAARQADNTFYAATDRRVMIQTGVSRGDRVEIHLADIPCLQLSQGRSGVGTIYFGTPGHREKHAVAGLGNGTGTPAFIAIDDVARVYDIVRKAKEALRAR